MKYEECKTEQSFKMEWIRRNKSKFIAVFPIETEETVKGFPDVLAIIEKYKGSEQFPLFLEFKKAHNGYVKFQPTQPAFYRANPKLNIFLIALVEKMRRFYVVALPRDIFISRINSMGKLDLRPFCFTEVKE